MAGPARNQRMQIGLATPPLNEITSFEQFQACYDRQTEHLIRLMVEGFNIVDGIHAEVLPSPF